MLGVVAMELITLRQHGNDREHQLLLHVRPSLTQRWRNTKSEKDNVWKHNPVCCKTVSVQYLVCIKRDLYED